MKCLIVRDGVIVNIITCPDEATATNFGAIPSYEGAKIGDIYSPKPTTEEILYAMLGVSRYE